MDKLPETRSISIPSGRNSEKTDEGAVSHDQINGRIAQLQSDLAVLQKSHAEMNQRHQETTAANFKRASQLEGAIVELRGLLKNE